MASGTPLRRPRIWGGKSGELGHSWSPVNPVSLDDARAQYGLPPGNAGTNLTRARIIDWTGVSARRALPLAGQRGGAIEYLIPDPEMQLEILEQVVMERPY